jgi:hypothetical protein
MADPTTTPYELTLEERPGYLYARVKAATITEEIAQSYLHKVARRCNDLDSTRLLLHRDIPATLPSGIAFFIATEFQSLIQGIRTAIVDPLVSNREDIDFAVTVANNRGGDYRAFTNDTDAEEWLLK